LILKQKSEKSPFVLSPVGYSGYTGLLHSLHSVQTRRDKKGEAISADQHTLKVVYVSLALNLFSLFLFKSIGILTFSQRTIFVILQT